MVNNEQTAASSVVQARTDVLCKHAMSHLADGTKEKMN